MLFLSAPEVTPGGSLCWVPSGSLWTANLALDNPLSHWSWQHECGHGAKSCFGGWDLTSFSSVAPQVTSCPLSMGLYQLQDMKSEGPFYVAPSSCHWYNIPNLAQWERTWNCRVLQELWKNQIQPVLGISSEEKTPDISSPELVLFSANSSQCKASTPLGIRNFFVGNCLCYYASGCPRCSSWALTMIAFAVADGCTSSKQRGSRRVLLI